MRPDPRYGRNLVNLFIALFWIFLTVDAYIQGRDLPQLLSRVDLPELPLATFVAAAFLISLLASFFTFRQRKNLMDEMPIVAARVDSWFGVGSYSRFTHRLHPVWATILSSTILGLVGMYSTYHFDHDVWSYAISSGSLLFAFFMLIAWFLSRRYPPVLS